MRRREQATQRWNPRSPAIPEQRSRALRPFREQRGGVHGPHDHPGGHCLMNLSRIYFGFGVDVGVW
jgi:hypothetical protein